MVNTINLSRYQGKPPKADTNRKIAGGPLYSAEELLLILETGVNSFTPITKRCLADIERFELSHDDIISLLRLCAESGKFRGSEWCRGSKDGHWLACDAYSVCRQEWIKASSKNMNIEYYLKFAIGKTGQVILMVSCHV
ncbi:MAG: hypothetical protein Q9M92_16465 [Enterobacterales bacterium]|nr:hypothetical protein [Enterobacterales bacterium]